MTRADIVTAAKQMRACPDLADAVTILITLVLTARHEVRTAETTVSLAKCDQEL